MGGDVDGLLFSPDGVALLPAPGSPAGPTVVTGSIAQARAYLAEYAAATGHGSVLAVLGDDGAGKTHLVGDLIRQADGTVGRALCASGTDGGFLALYLDFVKRLDLSGVRALVDTYHREAVLDAIRPFGDEVLAVLDGDAWQPADVVQRLALAASAVQREAHEAMSAAADSPQLAAVLRLLLRPGFEDIVWQWLTGSAPDPVLVDRGITGGVTTEFAALEALRAFVRLHTDRHERVLLVLDDLDKVVANAGMETAPALRAVMDAVIAGGGLLVVCGSSSMPHRLSDDVRLRIHDTVTATPFTAEEVRLLVQAHRGTTAPFTDNGLRYVHETTEGNARAVVRLCHQALRLTGGRPLDADALGPAARSSLGSLTSGQIAEQARTVLAEHGIAYSADHRLDPAHPPVDLWLTWADRRGGCAVLIAGTLVDAVDLEAVRRRVGDVHSAVPEAEVVVVTGRGTRGIGDRLRRTLGHEPLVYRGATFERDFLALVTTASTRLLLRQPRAHDLLEELNSKLGRTAAAAEVRLAAMNRRLDRLFETGVPGVAASSARGPLPQRVEELFRVALEALGEVTRASTGVDDAFGPEPEIARRALVARLRERHFITAAGWATVIHDAIRAFRDRVAEAYQADDLDQVKISCQDYDDLADHLPVFELAPLLDLAGRANRQTLISGLRDLGQRVEETILAAG